MQTIKAIRGMGDILPEQTALWQAVEQRVKNALNSYGYQEIRLPLVEPTALFARSIGDVTDIVEKEMYSFEDRKGAGISLRPEGTAGCVRAMIEHGLLKQQQRLWYHGPMFRYERPQAGRQRQFHQFGAEVFGFEGPDVDLELLLLTQQLWRALDLEDYLTLELNTIGEPAARKQYQLALVAYLEERQDKLDADSQRRLSTNPLRILDSKNPDTQALLGDAPQLEDFVDEESREHFASLCAMLDALGVSYVVNRRLVRGLDYYNKTVFEWTTTALGAQGAVCAGGRYDGLVEQLGGKATSAVGFALGVERLCLLVEQQMQQAAKKSGTAAQHQHLTDVYFTVMDSDLQLEGLKIAQQLREKMPQLRLLFHCGGGSLKSQMKKADKSAAQYALLLGQEEHAAGNVTIKPLRAAASIEQQQMDVQALEDFLVSEFSASHWH